MVEVEDKTKFLKQFAIKKEELEPRRLRVGDEIVVEGYKTKLVVKSVGTKIVKAQAPDLPFVFNIRMEDIIWKTPEQVKPKPLKTIRLSKAAASLIAKPKKRKAKKDLEELV